MGGVGPREGHRYPVCSPGPAYASGMTDILEWEDRTIAMRACSARARSTGLDGTLRAVLWAG